MAQSIVCPLDGGAVSRLFQVALALQGISRHWRHWG